MTEHTHPSIAIIGAGNMGGAILAGILHEQLTQPEKIRISDRRQERLDELKAEYGVLTFLDNEQTVDQVDIVILCVKPQHLGHVMAGLTGKLPKSALVISIVAGATLEQLCAGLDHECLVRCMPNTPAQIGEGITVWTNTTAVNDTQLMQAREILCAFGEEVHVDEENFLDMATALSGSGPAYVFLFMEAMIDAGVHLGFPRHIAEKLVSQTVRGSVNYYEKMKEHPAKMRNDVTSPGGTSAAALYYLEKAGLRTAISRAIWAAYERSVELGAGKLVHNPEKNG
ncbi:MAG: pyrroline-5-carboxylate reductase [Anaerolineaceae bacterium]|nr:pyrroline-5-carboxylate reductase [Anaerolineaceae bacterium]